jgi:hypothetical protein
MPWLKRDDGVPVGKLTELERIVPFVMRGRNESAVYTQISAEVDNLKQWRRAYNRLAPHAQATTWHLIAYFLRAFFDRHPHFNRFVSGKVIYQRRSLTVSMVAKESLSAAGRTYAVKVPIAPADEGLPAFVARVDGVLAAARHKPQVDPLVARALGLPGWLLAALARLQRWLDHQNLWPASLVQDDPLYTSCFFANLGSLGLPLAYHHLYEYGTCSFVMVLGAVEKGVRVDARGVARSVSILPVTFTIDERVIDGLAGGLALRMFRHWFHKPEEILGSPEEAARGLVQPTPGMHGVTSGVEQFD